MKDYHIKSNLDIQSTEGQELASLGRKEIELAEHEMPGLMALRKEFSPLQPLKRHALRDVCI